MKTNQDLKSYISREEIKKFTKKSNVKAFYILFLNWAAIFLIFAFVYVWTNPLSILVAFILLPGRQLGLSVIMHDCGHKVFFATKSYNDFFGQWFAANTVLQDLPSYAKGHLQHHKNAGTGQDPDLNNYRAYPIDKDSFTRKITRDITGQTGWKLFKLILGASKLAFSKDEADRKIAKPFVQEWFVQLVLLTILTITMSPWLYVLWLASWLTLYMLVVRLRQVAEHAAVEDLFDLDPRKNTRTTIANWFERALIAPNYVNYHLEHHFLASVPCYNLKALHALLKQRGAYDQTNIAYGYRQIFSEAIS
jgi:fatty acid desaturase